jgi:hypothetical protein
MDIKTTQYTAAAFRVVAVLLLAEVARLWGGLS